MTPQRWPAKLRWQRLKPGHYISQMQDEIKSIWSPSGWPHTRTAKGKSKHWQITMSNGKISHYEYTLSRAKEMAEGLHHTSLRSDTTPTQDTDS